MIMDDGELQQTTEIPVVVPQPAPERPILARLLDYSSKGGKTSHPLQSPSLGSTTPLYPAFAEMKRESELPRTGVGEESVIPLEIRPDDGVPFQDDWVAFCIKSLMERNIAAIWTPERRLLTALLARLKETEDLEKYRFLGPARDDFASSDFANIPEDDRVLLLLPESASFLRPYQKQREWALSDPVVRPLRDRGIVLLVYGSSRSLPGLDRAAVLALDDLDSWLPALLEGLQEQDGYCLADIRKQLHDQRALWPEDPVAFYQSIRDVIRNGDLAQHLNTLQTPAGMEEASSPWF